MPSPLCPTVTAMAAPMPIGAYFITRPVNLNITWASASRLSSMTSFGRPFTCVSPTPNRIDQKTICSTSFLTAASKTLAGTMWIEDVAEGLRLAVAAYCSPSLGSTCQIDADAGLGQVDGGQADEQGQRGDDLEVDERLERQPADALHVVAVAGDPDHERGEDERRDERLDHPQEDRRERLQFLRRLRERPPDRACPRTIEIRIHCVSEIRRRILSMGGTSGRE